MSLDYITPILSLPFHTQPTLLIAISRRSQTNPLVVSTSSATPNPPPLILSLVPSIYPSMPTSIYPSGLAPLLSPTKPIHPLAPHPSARPRHLRSRRAPRARRRRNVLRWGPSDWAHQSQPGRSITGGEWREGKGGSNSERRARHQPHVPSSRTSTSPGPATAPPAHSVPLQVNLRPPSPS
jgi:hypothetical protein